MSQPTLRAVCEELSEVEHKADRIAIQLGISRSKLSAFKQEGDVLSASVEYWLGGNVPDVPITWMSVVKALQTKYVGETGLADKIREKYCQKKAPAIEPITINPTSAALMENSTVVSNAVSTNDSTDFMTTTTEVTVKDPISTATATNSTIDSNDGIDSNSTTSGSTSKDRLRQKFPYLNKSVESLSNKQKDDLCYRLEQDSEDIRGKFAALVTKTGLFLTNITNINDHIKSFFTQYGLKEFAMSIDPEDTVPHVMERIHDIGAWSFFNYELLEKIINALCSSEQNIRDDMKTYISDFQQFCERRLYEVPTESHTTKELPTEEEVIFKIDKKICCDEDLTKSSSEGEDEELGLTLNETKKFQSKVTKILQHEFLIFREAQKGCIELTFQHFKKTNPVLLLTTTDKITLALMGVRRIRCGTESQDLQLYISLPSTMKKSSESSQSDQEICPMSDILKAKMEDLSKWISECEDSIEDPSLSDWRRKKLMEGIKLYEEFLQKCQQNQTGNNTTELQQQQIGLGSAATSTQLYTVDEVRKFLWSQFTATKLDHIIATPLRSTEQWSHMTWRKSGKYWGVQSIV